MKNKLNSKLSSFVMLGPTAIWLVLFVFIPLFYVVGISFLTKNAHGSVDMLFSLASYRSLFQREYVKIFIDSMGLSLQTTILCLLIGYPFAYIITKAPPNKKKYMVLLIMLPFWINSIIRIYGWNTLLRSEGIINNLLILLGIIPKPLQMLYTNGAVLLGMVYELLPFTILPIYTSLEKMDSSLIEAAEDLGTSKGSTFLRVIFPLTMPGIFAGSIQTFIPSLGLFYVSEMMGGGTNMYIGNLIKNQFLSARNWPLGAALSIVLILITLILMKLYTRVGSLEDMA